MSDVINYPLSAAIELCEQLDKSTPETDALISVGLENADRECVPADFARKLERERDEARENLDEEMKFHHRTHAELVQTQCKLLDMEMKCDQLQDEIKRLKIILDLIKKDTI
jgi:hypothetical protein